jgi:hypothetical protein
MTPAFFEGDVIFRSLEIIFFGKGKKQDLPPPFS